MPVLRSAFSWGKIRLWPKTRVSRARLTTWARLPKSQLSEPVLDLPLVKIINTTITTKKWRKHRLFYCTDLKTHKMMFFSQKKNHYTTNTTSTKKQQLMIALEKPTIQQDSSIQGGRMHPQQQVKYSMVAKRRRGMMGQFFSISQVTSNFSLLNNFKPTKLVLDFVRKRIPETHHHCWRRKNAWLRWEFFSYDSVSGPDGVRLGKCSLCMKKLESCQNATLPACRKQSCQVAPILLFTVFGRS